MHSQLKDFYAGSSGVEAKRAFFSCTPSFYEEGHPPRSRKQTSSHLSLPNKNCLLALDPPWAEENETHDWFRSIVTSPLGWHMAASTKPVFCWQNRKAVVIWQATGDDHNKNDKLGFTICPEILYILYLNKYTISTMSCIIIWVCHIHGHIHVYMCIHKNIHTWYLLSILHF